jgi:hypothetical protein
MENPLMNQERNGETCGHLSSEDEALNGRTETQGEGGVNGDGGSGPAQVRSSQCGVRSGEGREGESIFSWEHGVEVEPWAEPVDGRALLDALTSVLKRFVVLGRFAAETLALWILHTYGFRLRDVTTYVGVESPQKRCGKTTLLTVLSELVNRPVVASNISSPAFFRVIEEKHPTLMIDEADTVLHRNDELRGILNAGYKRKTAYVVRVAAEVRNAERCAGEN